MAAGGAELWGRGRGLGDGGGGRGRARREVPGALQRLKAMIKATKRPRLSGSSTRVAFGGPSIFLTSFSRSRCSGRGPALSEQSRGGLRFRPIFPVPRPRIAWASSTARCSTRVTPGILRRRAEFKASSTSQGASSGLPTRPPSALSALCRKCRNKAHWPLEG